jgi:hypothetical protein
LARYRLLAPHVIDGVYLLSGAVVDGDLSPTPDMDPLDDDAVSRVKSMRCRDWRMAITAESLPGSRHIDGSPVLLNRPENMGRPMTWNPPQPHPTREIPSGCCSEPNMPCAPPDHYWTPHTGSVSPNDPLIPYVKGA